MKHIKLFEAFVASKLNESTKDSHYKYDFTPQLGTGDHLGTRNELKKGHEFWSEVEGILKDVPKAADATTLGELKRAFGKADVLDGKINGNATQTVIVNLGETPSGFPINASLTPLKYHLFRTNEYGTFKGDFKVSSIYCKTPGNITIDLMSLDHDHIDGTFRGYGYMKYGEGFPAPSNWKGPYVDKQHKVLSSY
jgi:hypothetical protein